MWKDKLFTFRKRSIKRDILIIAVVPILILATFITPYVIYQSSTALAASLHEKGESIINQLALSSEYGLITGNTSELNSLVEKLIATEQEILSIKILNSENETIIEHFSNSPFSNDFILFSKDINSSLTAIDTFDLDDDLHLSDSGTVALKNFQSLGKVELSLSKNILKIKQFNFIINVILIGLLAFAISIIIAFRIAHKFSNQLSTISAAVKEISDGNLKVRSNVDNSNEIGQLSKNINKMTSKLYKANNAINRNIVEITQARENAENANKAKDEFLALISHEIRTPLNAVLGMLQALEDTSANNIQKRYIRVSLDNAKHLIGLIDDILNFSSLTHGGISIEKEACDLVSISHQIISNYKLCAEKKNLIINQTYQGDNDLKNALLLIDPTRIKQILINLISNAIKFTHKGAINVAIDYKKLPDQQAKVVIRVQDTGIGIAEKDLPHIFDTFSRVDASTNRSFEGMGLGLSITKQLVQLMNGDIQVYSEEGVGTTFICDFTFDYLINNAANQDANRENKNLSKHFKILLAEDQLSNQETFTALFNNYGADIDIASNGEIALQYLQDNDYDMVFVDCHMPGMDGFELVKRIRATNNNNQRIPIIAITADILPSTQKKCYEVGMDDFIPKPIRKFDLYNKTEIWLNAQSQVDKLIENMHS